MPQKDLQIGSLLLCKVLHSLVLKLSFPGFHLINWTQCLTTRKWRGSNRSLPIGPFASIFGGFDDPAAARSRTPGCYLGRAFDCGSKQSGRGRSNASAAADAALYWQRSGSEGERDKEGEICAEATAASKQKRQKETQRGFLPDYHGLFSPFLPVRQRYAITAAK